MALFESPADVSATRRHLAPTTKSAVLPFTHWISISARTSLDSKIVFEPFSSRWIFLTAAKVRKWFVERERSKERQRYTTRKSFLLFEGETIGRWGTTEARTVATTKFVIFIRRIRLSTDVGKGMPRFARFVPLFRLKFSNFDCGINFCYYDYHYE